MRQQMLFQCVSLQRQVCFSHAPGNACSLLGRESLKRHPGSHSDMASSASAMVCASFLNSLPSSFLLGTVGVEGGGMRAWQLGAKREGEAAHSLLE